MTIQQYGQVAATLVAVLTPLLVVGIVRLVATRQAELVNERLGGRNRAMRTLVSATGVVGVITVPLAWSFPPLTIWPGIVGVTAFAVLAVFGVRALSELDAASHSSRIVSSKAREASLSPRRLDDYVSLPLRLVPFVIAALGTAVFIVRAAVPAGSRQLFVPVTFAVAAVVFVWLYEVWMRDLVSGPVVAGSRIDDDTRRRRIRGVLAMESVLAATCLLVANLLLNLDWQTHGAAGTTASLGGGLVAIVGCALALSSNVSRRTYATTGR